jgi:hypothetical protein
MIFFNRKVELTVYTENEKHVITDLHFAFNVSLRRPVQSKQKNPPMPNQALVKVYGLSDKSRNLFEDAHKGIDLKAGYGDVLSLIFRGVTTNVYSARFGTDWETVISAADGHAEFSTARFNKAYSKGTTISSIVKDLGDAMGMPPVIDYDRPDVLLSSMSFQGRVKDCLDTVCQNWDLTWEIQQGSLMVHDNQLPQLFEARFKKVILGPTTGMIGSPVIQAESRNETKKGKKSDEENAKLFLRASARSLLNPEIFPNVPIEFKSEAPAYQIADPLKKVPSAKLESVYICDKVNHHGSNFGKEFYTDIVSSESEAT